MKNIRLNSINIQNFKGCRDLAIYFTDKTCIYGANAVGKTTIADAMQWLLFGKDSQGTEKFQIRPLDSEGNMINNIDIKVFAVFSVDNKEIELQKVQKQKWVKKRGSSTAELQGNTNEYEVNGIPKSEAEYKRIVSDLVEESLFKLLTNPRAFTAMNWQEQRSILLNLISEISDIEVIRSNYLKYSELEEQLNRFSVKELIAKAKKALKEWKQQQAEIPARIDEAHRALVDIDVTELELHQNALNEQIDETESLMEDHEKIYIDYQAKKDRVLSLKFEISGMEQDANAELIRKRRQIQTEISELQYQYSSSRNTVLNMEKEIENKNTAYCILQNKKQRLIEEYTSVKAEVFDEISLNCPTCGQFLPEKERNRLLAEFKTSKENQMDRIIREGDSTKVSKVATVEEIRKMEVEKQGIELEMESFADKINALKQDLEKMPEKVDCSSNYDYVKKKQELEKLEASIADTNTGVEYRSQLKIKLAGLREELSDVEKKIASADNSKTEERISELKQKQKEVGQNVADQERMIYLLEQFTRDKLNLLGIKINSKFALVNFKLFSRNINGGISECCECTMDGIPYSDLNSGHKIIAGLDIISSLSGLYDVKVPVIIDNAESLNDFNVPDMDCQMILLKVSEDKKLRIA